MNIAAAVAAYRHCRRWWIAYSGGVDSHVLLHALAQLRDTEKNLPPLSVIHINHQLNPRASDWAQHCQTVCAQLGIELVIETVNVVRDGGAGIEAAARIARYAAFEKHVLKDELLLQAHHADDQVETLMLRLLRGSGVAGLAAIPPARSLGQGELLRPLLTVTRAEILAYAQQHQLQWIDDDSNNDAHFDRNFLRLQVLPRIAERWPAYRNTLARVVEQAGEASLLIEALAAHDFALASADDGGLNIAAYLELSSERRRNVLRYWLQQTRLPLPTRAQLQQIESMVDARIDAAPCVRWVGAEVHRFRGNLYAQPALPPLRGDIDTEWPIGAELAVSGLGILTASRTMGQGLRADRNYHVRNRRGGERCKPIGRAHSQTLKKLMQERAVQPWLRDRLPLIYCGDELAAVANLWICAGFAAHSDQPGWLIDWRLSL
ncbi:MAG: tRNA lysidine(34) synthetase TilS [Verrucomicrobiaceae bacterium]|nr:tRNA lysidine(34) synthetase TilS [Verrucomicrobiaceae bacterium]